ncbi:MAG TPA: hypothetical protein ENK55_03470 [Actinobacteria bacterium]|nr:hypothetical protein [Actinomycetota bacterium]
MGSFSFSEILVIVFVILVVFGPDRLPEFARRTGAFVGKLREATGFLTEQLERELGPEMAAVRDLDRQIEGVKDDLSRGLRRLTTLEEAAAEAQEDVAASTTEPDAGADPAEGPLTVFDADPDGEVPPSP